LNDSLIVLAKDALASLRNLLPIVVVISLFQVFVFREPVSGLMSMAIGGFVVVAGLTFFMFGLRLALFPIGEGLAHSLAKKGSVFWLVVFAFALGFGTTIAEPALIAVATAAAEVAAGAEAIASSVEAKDSYAQGLRADWSLPIMIISGYILVVLITTFAPDEIVGIAYDCGGVTTSTVTVPLVAALGVGLASSIKGRNPMTDGFGLIAFASLTPILFVLVYEIIVQWN